VSSGPKRDRAGQQIGSLEVLADHGRTKRNRNGGRQVIWRCLDHATGRECFLRTSALIRLDRAILASNDGVR
jgi:hypothetical protein